MFNDVLCVCKADAKAIRAESELPDLWNDASHAPEPWQLCKVLFASAIGSIGYPTKCLDMRFAVSKHPALKFECSKMECRTQCGCF